MKLAVILLLSLLTACGEVQPIKDTTRERCENEYFLCRCNCNNRHDIADTCITNCDLERERCLYSGEEE
jgi:hypothetical protein